MDFYLKTHIKDIALDLKSKLVSNHISSLSFISNDSLILTFSYYRKNDLFINLNNNNPFIGFILKTKAISNLNKDIPFKFRHFVKDSYINDVETLNDDTIIRFDLSKKVDEFDYKKYFLIIELIHGKTNLILTDQNYQIILVYKPSDILSLRNLTIGQTYTCPKENKIINEKEESVDYQTYLKYGQNLFFESLKKRKKEKFAKLYQFLHKKIKILTNKFPKLEEEIKKGESDLVYKEIGEACYYYSEDELEKLFLEDNKKIDKSKTNIELANDCFIKYKKAKSKIENANKQLKQCQDDLMYYQHLLEQFENGEEDDVLQMESYLIGKNDISKQEKSTINKLSPYAIKLGNTKILFGKNDMQNDNLTFKIAKDNDLFFHIHPYSGSHVILRGDNITDKEKNIACQICLIGSKKQSSDVIYTLKKYVKKGHKLGQVILKKYQIAKINNVSEESKKLYESAQKI